MEQNACYNILVVDDDKQMATNLADMLKMLNHNVTMAFGPRGALFHLGQMRPDILFLDINMPGIDGLEICRYLRRDPNTAGIPIVVISAHEEPAYKDAAARAGANYYIVKPPMFEDLELALKHIMPSTS
jgi:PleD family two-component response regulator